MGIQINHQIQINQVKVAVKLVHAAKMTTVQLPPATTTMLPLPPEPGPELPVLASVASKLPKRPLLMSVLAVRAHVLKENIAG